MSTSCREAGTLVDQQGHQATYKTFHTKFILPTIIAERGMEERLSQWPTIHVNKSCFAPSRDSIPTGHLCLQSD